MRKYIFFWLGFVILGITASLSGCYKEPVYSIIPQITFKNIQKQIIIDQFSGAKTDSVIITIGYQDGDGDLGENEIDKKNSSDSLNYLVKVFESKNGVFSEKVQTVTYSGIFPRFIASDQPGPIYGDLNYSLNFPQPFTPKNDTLKFQIYIKDRAGHTSNTVETTPIVLHQF